MTKRFPHDFWTERNLNLQPEYRFDGSLKQGLGNAGPYGFSRSDDWETLSPMNPQEELLRHFIDETVLDEMEFDEEPLDEGPHACLITDLHPTGESTGLYIPEKYEPNYPYPVILWFHDAGGNETNLLSLMPAISSQNYFGLSLRGSLAQETGFDWPIDADSLTRLENDIYKTVCELRRNFHIHSERVFMAGSGSGATTALRLLLSRTEWFAGVFAFGGELPPLDPQWTAHPELSERRVFQTLPATDSPEGFSDAQQTARLWKSAGLNLITELENRPAHVSENRLSQLNHWLMETICTPV